MRRTMVGIAAAGLFAGTCAIADTAAEVAAPVSVVSQEAIESLPVASGFGTMKLDGLLQMTYSSVDGADPQDTFRVRRTEIKVSGEVAPKASWMVMIDPAQVREDDIASMDIDGVSHLTSAGRKSILQDAVLTYKPCPHGQIDVGQYKVPFGMESLTPNSKLDFIDRSSLSWDFGWGDHRDIGISATRKFEVKSVKITPTLGVFNGSRQNGLDVNNPMAFAGRVVVNPCDNWQFGAAYYTGDTGTDEAENSHVGGEIKFCKDPFSVYGEYAQGKVGDTDMQSYYVAGTYKFLTDYQVALRYDAYDPDTDSDDNALSDTTLGLNYFLEKTNAKFSANYVFRGEETGSVDNDVVKLLAQISF